MKVLFKVMLLTLVICSCSFSQVLAQDAMSESATDALKGMSELFMHNLNTSQTLGRPFEAGDYTVIPVVAKGLGFGLGTKLEAKDKEVGNAGAGKNESHQKDRIGMGGGGFVKPVALIMIKKDGTFKVVKLSEGIFAQMAKHMVPAIGSLITRTIKAVATEKLKFLKNRYKAERQAAKNMEKAKNTKKVENTDKAINMENTDKAIKIDKVDNLENDDNSPKSDLQGITAPASGN